MLNFAVQYWVEHGGLPIAFTMHKKYKGLAWILECFFGYFSGSPKLLIALLVISDP